jgi:hypothetical protein
VLSNQLSSKQISSIAQTFVDPDYLESRQFTSLHKTILGLSVSINTLESTLELSTSLINQTDANGRTCLSWASARNDQASLDILLRYGADPRILDNEGQSPLIQAVRVGSHGCIASLVQSGLNISSKSAFGGTVLHAAAAAPDNPGTLKLLIDDGRVDINTIDFDGGTALHAAARADRVENARALLNAGVDPNIANVAGETAIFHAIHWYAYKTLGLLVSWGVDIDVRSSDGRTVLHALACHLDEKMLQAMRGVRFKNVTPQTTDNNGVTCLEYLNSTSDSAVKYSVSFEDFLAHVSPDARPDDEVFEDALEFLS